MITNYGKQRFVSFVAGHEASFGSAVSIGVGTTAAAGADVNLVSEAYRFPISLRSPDYIASEVIYKATIPAEVSGKFYEVGVNLRDRQRASHVLYGNIDEVWTNGTLDAQFARVGDSAVRVNASASGNTTASINKDMAIGAASTVSLNYHVGSNVSSSYVRLRTDASNYYHYALPVTAGYNTVSVPLTSFTPTGAPSPDNITSVVVYLASTAGGASQLHLDSITVQNPEVGGDLLVRQVLAQPITKQAGTELDIEIPVTLT